MFSGLVRAASSGLPWLAVMAASVSLGYGLDVAVTRGVSTTIRAGESVPYPDRSLVLQRCVASVADPIYAAVDMDSSIVAKSRQAMCDRAALITAQRSESDHACAKSMLYVGLNTWVSDPSRAVLCSAKFTPDE